MHRPLAGRHPDTTAPAPIAAAAKTPDSRAPSSGTRTLWVVPLTTAALLSTVVQVPAPVRAVLVACALLTTPGLALLGYARVRSLASRAALVVPLSIAIEMCISLAMVWTTLWFPQAAGAVLLTAAAICIVAQDRRSGALGRAVRGFPFRGAISARQVLFEHARRTRAIGGLALALGAAGWLVSLVPVRGDVGDGGLLALLPPYWYAALSVVIATLVYAVARPAALGRPLVGAHVALLTLMLYGTASLVSSVPRLPWTYKHIAVARFIEANGAVDPSLDLYQRWPGFFAWAAQLSAVMNVPNPVDWARAAEPLIALIDAALMFALAKQLVRNDTIALSAVLVFTGANWINQNYFAPQAVAYMFFLALALVLLSAQAAHPGRAALRAEGLVARVVRARAGVETPARRATARVPLGLVALLWIGIVASHQLTPFISLLVLAPLMLVGYLPSRWLAFALAASAVAYLIPNLQFIQSHYGLFSGFDPFDNATYRPQAAGGMTPTETTTALLDYAIAATVYLVAAVGLFRRARAGEVRSSVLVAWMLIAPFVVLLGQSYGGEGRLRAYLFSLPWAAIAAAWSVNPLVGSCGSWKPRAAWAAGTAILLSAFTVAYFLNEADAVVPSSDVRAAEWIDSHASKRNLVIATSPDFPLLIGPHYDALVPDASLSVYAPYYRRAPTRADVVALGRELAKRRTVSAVDIVFSEEQSRFDASHALFVEGALARLEVEIRGTATDRRIYDEEGVRIYRLEIPR